MATRDQVEDRDLVWEARPRRSTLIFHFVVSVVSRCVLIVMAILVTALFLTHVDLSPETGASPVLRALTWGGLGFANVIVVLALLSLPLVAVTFSRDLRARYLALDDRFIIQRPGLPGGEAIHRFEDLKRVQVFRQGELAVLINQPKRIRPSRKGVGYPHLPRNSTMLALPEARELLSQLPIDVTDVSFLGFKA